MVLDRDTTFTSYGHSCMEVRTPGGKVILIDPWFANPRSPRTADSIDACDLLLVTHGHFDHMGDAVALASRLRPAWPCMHEMSLWLARRLPGGADAAVGMNKGGTFEVDGIRVTMTHATHSAGDWNPGGETTLYLGDPAGFVVELENGFTFYFAGDTDLFGDMRYIGELHRPDVAFLPIGGHFTMGPRAGRDRRRAPGRQPRRPDPLRHVPDPGRHPGSAQGRTGHSGPLERPGPRARARREPRLAPRAGLSQRRTRRRGPARLGGIERGPVRSRGPQEGVQSRDAVTLRIGEPLT